MTDNINRLERLEIIRRSQIFQRYGSNQSDNMKERLKDKEKQEEEKKQNFAWAMLEDLELEKPLDLQHIADEYDNIEGPGHCISLWCNKDYDFFGKHLRQSHVCLKNAERIYTGKIFL